MKTILIFTSIFILSQSVYAKSAPVRHSHDGRTHTHVLPNNGVGKHNHGSSQRSKQSKPISSTRATNRTSKKENEERFLKTYGFHRENWHDLYYPQGKLRKANFNGEGWITLEKKNPFRTVTIWGNFKNGVLTGEGELKTAVVKCIGSPSGWFGACGKGNSKSMTSTVKIRSSSDIKEIAELQIRDLSSSVDKLIASSRGTSGSTSSYSSSLKYGCKFCCEGSGGNCRSSKFQINTPATNSLDAENYIKREYENICKGYPFHKTGQGSASVSFPNCETYYYKD